MQEPLFQDTVGVMTVIIMIPVFFQWLALIGYALGNYLGVGAAYLCHILG